HAVVMTNAEDVQRATAIFNVWEPYVNTSDGGVFSLSQMWITSADPILETVEAGWHVYPSLWRDNRVRFFVFYTLDRYKTLCYNFQCGGFVQEGRLSPGMPFQDVSKYDRQQWETSISIAREHRGNNMVWAVYIQNNLVGHWPASLFRNLNQPAKRVDFGGEVAFVQDSERTSHTRSHMGSGHFPGEGFKKGAYIRNIQLFDSHGTRISRFRERTHYATHPQCYDIKEYSSTDDHWGDYIFYGGPGADAHSCV
ncbi:hypothetical protein KI387_025422, partial [Taxus chinensis]